MSARGLYGPMPGAVLAPTACMDDARDIEFNNAKAAAERLQDAAHGGPPVAIPGGTGPVHAETTPPASVPPIPSTDDDRAEDRLDGGGR